VLALYYPLKTSLYCVQFLFGNPCFFSALVQVACVSLAKFASRLVLVVVILSMLSLLLILRVHLGSCLCLVCLCFLRGSHVY
jgi:hypothetical protein